MNFEVIFKTHFRAKKKYSKIIIDHRPSKPTIDFLEMLTSMEDSLCPLVRQLVKANLLDRIKCDFFSFEFFKGSRYYSRLDQGIV